ncbi:MAG: hypothetical protein ACREAB_20215, partial [Blastocatellia bacterium]
MNPDQSYASNLTAPIVEPPRLNFFSRVIGVWFSPGETFAEIGQAKGIFGTILAPILGLMIIGAAFGAVGANRMGIENLIREAEKPIQQMIDKGRIPQE